MPIDFEAVKKLPVEEQGAEFKRIIASLEKQIAETKEQTAKLEKEKKNKENNEKIADLRKTLDALTKDRNSAEQLLARSELDAKALETVLQEQRIERPQEQTQEQARQRQELENIVAAERTRELERKRDEKRPD